MLEAYKPAGTPACMQGLCISSYTNGFDGHGDLIHITGILLYEIKWSNAFTYLR